VQDYLEGLFLVVSLEVAILGVEEEEDKLITQIQSFLELSLVVEDQEAATVGGGEDKHQERISLAQDSLGCWEEGIITVVIAPHNITTTKMVDTTMVTIMDITMVTTVDTTVDTTLEGVDTTVDTTLGGVDTIQEGVDSIQEGVDTIQEGVNTIQEGVDITQEEVDTIQEGVDPPVSGVSVTTDLCSRTSMGLHMVLVREGMRLVRDGVILRGMAVKMPGSHRGFLTTLGHT